MLSKMIGKGGARLVRALLHKSLEHVHTSAAPFLRHLLVPSSQQPRSSTTPFTYCLTQPRLFMRSLHSCTGSWMRTPSSDSVSGPWQGVPLCPPHTQHLKFSPRPGRLNMINQARTKLDRLKPGGILRHGPLPSKPATPKESKSGPQSENLFSLFEQV